VRFNSAVQPRIWSFTLKELVIVCLRSLTLNQHVASLREVFQRAAFARQRVDADLLAAPPVPDAIRSAVFKLGHNPGESLSNAMTDKPRLIEVAFPLEQPRCERA